MERSVFFIYDAISQIIKEPPNLVKSFVVFQLLSYVWLFATPWTAALQASLSFTISQTLLNSCALSWWCHPTISSSVAPFSSCPQSFPASGSFPMSWLLTSGSRSIGASASASVLLVNIQGWFPLELTGFIFSVGPAMQETQVQFLGRENPLEKEMAIHSSILAWRIPLTKESGRLQSMESQELDTT